MAKKRSIAKEMIAGMEEFLMSRYYAATHIYKDVGGAYHHVNYVCDKQDPDFAMCFGDDRKGAAEHAAKLNQEEHGNAAV